MNNGFRIKSRWYHRVLAVLFFISLVVGVICFAPIDILVHLFIRKWHRFTQPAVWFFKVAFKVFGIKVTVIGREHIPKAPGFVVAANHQSFIDIGVIWRSIGVCAFLAKKDLWKIPGFGKILDLTGSIPVNRKSHRENLKIGARLKNGLNRHFNYCVYPEGARSRNGKILPFKNGIFKMAKQHQMILLPVTIVDSGRRLPSSELAFHPGEIKVVIHAPVFPENYETLSVLELRNQIQETVEAPLENLSEIHGGKNV
ncbi:MAG: 1-acyl-sn-glycerol-3-phosphate acyltransferase [Fibrobacter sp.]|nr:1-acyl-sn-glycerol-3-phosphate acyltransferase [Fibrobacter sp.]